MEIQLKAKLQQPVRVVIRQEILDSEIEEQKASDIETWLGKQPGSFRQLETNINKILASLENSVHASTIPQLGGSQSILLDLVNAFQTQPGDSSSSLLRLHQVYQRLSQLPLPARKFAKRILLVKYSPPMKSILQLLYPMKR